MSNGQQQWSWRAYVYGLMTPLALGIGITVLSTIAVLLTRPRGLNAGGE